MKEEVVKTKKFILLPVLMVFLIMSISGCVFMVAGGAGALGGYAVSRDTIKGHSGKPYRSIWGSALRVARIKGKITMENKDNGEIEFEVKPSRVWVKLTKLTDASTEIRVSARRYSLPNLGLAEEIFVKIMEELK